MAIDENLPCSIKQHLPPSGLVAYPPPGVRPDKWTRAGQLRCPTPWGSDPEKSGHKLAGWCPGLGVRPRQKCGPGGQTPTKVDTSRRSMLSWQMQAQGKRDAGTVLDIAAALG